MEAGHDPRDFVLYAFGGAGPAHCAAYAAEVGVREVVVPLGQVASAFSAYGLAASDIVLAAEFSDPSAFPMDPVRVEKNFAQLEAQVRDALDRQGVRFGQVELAREIDMRYSMQLAELATPVSDGPIDAAELNATAARFEQRYADLFGAGSGFREAGIQAITYRVRATGVLQFSPGLPPVAQADGADPAIARTGTRPVRLGTGGFTDTAIYDYSKLQAGHLIAGPAVVEVPTTTVVVPGGMTGTVDPFGQSDHHPRGVSLMTMPVPGSEAFSSRRFNPQALAASLPSSLPVHSVTQEQIDALDPLTYEVIRHRLWSVTEEMGEAPQAHVRLPHRHRRQRLRLRDRRRAGPGGPGRPVQHDAGRGGGPGHLLDPGQPGRQPRHQRGRHVPVQRSLGRRWPASERRHRLPANLPRGHAVRLDQRDLPRAGPGRRGSRLVLAGGAGRLLRIGADTAGQGRPRLPAAARRRRPVGPPVPGPDARRPGPARSGRRQQRRRATGCSP